MSTHPLAQDDYELIQDLMLTKVVFLLASEADASEWQFELRAQESLSEGRWDGRNAFLFDYTLARVLNANLRVTDATAQAGIDWAPPGQTEFLDDFLLAISYSDHPRAAAIWTTGHAVPAQSPQASTAATLALIRALQERHHPELITPALEQLDGPFHPDLAVS